MALEKEDDFDEQAIRELVRGLDPIDWVQMRLIAQLPPAERILRVMLQVELVREQVREEIRQQFPELSPGEVNMRMLRRLTTVIMPQEQ